MAQRAVTLYAMAGLWIEVALGLGCAADTGPMRDGRWSYSLQERYIKTLISATRS
jgi:hypothetical protein